MPSDELAKKTLVTAAVGGIGVAAAGGSNREVLDGFLRAGAMVLIQDGYTKMTNGNLVEDSKVASGSSYCMQALPGEAACAPPDKAYVRNPDGSIARGPDGNPKIDIREVDHTKPVVGKASLAGDAKTALGRVGQELASDKGITMRTLALAIPGANAGALFHDQWVMVSAMSSIENALTIGPAMVLIYNGTAAPLNNAIQEAAVKSAAEKDKSLEPTRPQQSFMCAKGKDQRAISVHEPTNLPEVNCAVIYEHNSQASSPWIAVNDPSFCSKRSEEIVAKHQSQGWTCYARNDARRTAEVAGLQ